MRAHGAIVSLIFAIAFYFMLFWGFDALRILTSPMYGLDDVWRSQVVFGMGRYTGLGPEGLIKLAAVLGALKLVVAGACAIHIVDRARAMIGGTADPGTLEAGMMLVVLITVASVAPALWTQNIDLVREHLIQLMLAGLAGALLIMERGRADSGTVDAAPVVEAPQAPRFWFAPWRS